MLITPPPPSPVPEGRVWEIVKALVSELAVLPAESVQSTRHTTWLPALTVDSLYWLLALLLLMFRAVPLFIVPRTSLSMLQLLIPLVSLTK